MKKLVFHKPSKNLYCVTIREDEHADNPNDIGDTTFLIYEHRQFHVEVIGFDCKTIFSNSYSHHTILNCRYYTHNNGKNYYCFPVYAYIHSGVSLSLSHSGDRFDISFRGFILSECKEETQEEYSEAKRIAQITIDEWNNYLDGNIYTYQINKATYNNDLQAYSFDIEICHIGGITGDNEILTAFENREEDTDLEFTEDTIEIVDFRADRINLYKLPPDLINQFNLEI